MITFHETDKSTIKEKHRQYFHDKARYFNINKDNKNIGYYGVIIHSDKVCEAFLMFKTFKDKVLSKKFFVNLFNHLFSLGYDEVYTWSTWDRLISIFRHFSKYGIYQTECPDWDKDPTKTWFMKRI